MMPGEGLLKLDHAGTVAPLRFSQLDPFAIRKAPPFSAVQHFEKSALLSRIPYRPGRKRRLAYRRTSMQGKFGQVSPPFLQPWLRFGGAGRPSARVFGRSSKSAE